MGKDVIIACDFNSKAEVIAFLEKFKDEKLSLIHICARAVEKIDGVRIIVI